MSERPGFYAARYDTIAAFDITRVCKSDKLFASCDCLKSRRSPGEMIFSLVRSERSQRNEFLRWKFFMPLLFARRHFRSYKERRGVVCVEKYFGDNWLEVDAKKEPWFLCYPATVCVCPSRKRTGSWRMIATASIRVFLYKFFFAIYPTDRLIKLAHRDRRVGFLFAESRNMYNISPSKGSADRSIRNSAMSRRRGFFAFSSRKISGDYVPVG